MEGLTGPPGHSRLAAKHKSAILATYTVGKNPPSLPARNWLATSEMPIEKIIVLEDDLVVRKTLEQQLRYRRYDVASAENIASAVELLGKDNFDLMIVDVKLPDGDGIELL